MYRLNMCVVTNLKRTAVDIALEAFLTNNKSAENLKCLLALSSCEKYVEKYKMGVLHKCVLGLNDFDIKLSLGGNHDYLIDEKDAYGQTALYWAALRANVRAMSCLLEAGADADIKNNLGCGILTASLMSNESSCVQKLLQFGCEVNYTDADWYTSLHHSCS